MERMSGKVVYISPQKMTTSHCTDYTFCLRADKRVRRPETNLFFLCAAATHTDKCTVTTCRTEIKVRKGGGYFYGKQEGNENYSQGV